MRHIFHFFAIIVLLCGVTSAQVPGIVITPVTDDVIILKTAGSPTGPNVTAISAEKGIVIIDTHIFCRAAEKIRAAVLLI